MPLSPISFILAESISNYVLFGSVNYFSSIELSMTDGEPDYLSDEFILNPVKDIRPGLLFNSTQKRRHEAAKRQSEANKKSKTRPLKIIEAEKRDQALGNALLPDNKGFAMLQRMGYKPGMTLGKLGSTTGASLKEPLRPVLKNDRLGLGQEADQKERAQERVNRLQEQHMHKVRHAQELAVDFQARVRDQRKEKQMLGDLWKSQKVCLQLDSEATIEAKESWFWPEIVQADDKDSSEECSEKDDDAEAVIIEKSEQLKTLTNYLREAYFYCLWCGTRYNDNDDLNSNCPGPTFDDHE